MYGALHSVDHLSDCQCFKSSVPLHCISLTVGFPYPPPHPFSYAFEPVVRITGWDASLLLLSFRI
jgi:hypothetical protein